MEKDKIIELGNQPAFSCVGYGYDGNSYHQPGLTKREYFAAMAMMGFLGNSYWAKENPLPPEDLSNNDKGLAERCVNMADALIEQLNQTNPNT